MLSYIMIVIMSLLASLLTLFSGFGLGTILLPVFAMFFPVQVAVASTAIVHLANNLFKAALVGYKADLKIVIRFALPAAFAAVLGAWIFIKLGNVAPIMSYTILNHTFDVQLVKLMIGILISVFSILELIPRFQKLSLSSKYVPMGGLLSGFFGGLSGIQGALRSMFLIRVGLSKDQFVGTTVLSAIVVDISRMLVYGFAIFSHHLSSLKTQGDPGLVLAAVIAALSGALLGTQLLKKTTLKTVQKIVGGMLLLLSLGLMMGLI